MKERFKGKDLNKILWRYAVDPNKLTGEQRKALDCGSSTKYIALTDREYQRLQDSDWEAVESFASQF